MCKIKLHTYKGLSLLLCLVLSACVTENAYQNISPNLGTELLPPNGWQAYCATEKTKESPDPACVDNGRWRQISSVHNHVNRAVTYKPDTNNTWQIAKETGDCEDFTLRYRAELLSRGWHSRNLMPALCKTPAGINHMNLLVNTSQGIYVLDNRHSTVKPYAQAQCKYIALYQPS